MAPTKPKSAWRKRIVTREVAKLDGLSPKLYKINNLSAESFMKRFDKAAKKHGFKTKRMRFGRSVYTLGKGPERVLFNSGIHGEERAGPIALLTWLERTDKGQLISENFSLMISPLVGHDAWNNKRRKENNKINLNSVWVSKNEKKERFQHASVRPPKYVTDIRKAMIKFDPTFFLDFHEDTTIKDNEPYLWRNFKNRGAIYDLQEAVGVSRKKGGWAIEDANKTTAEIFVYELGCEQTSTVETPQTKSLKYRVAFDLAIIHWTFNTLSKHQSNAEAP
jgi:predicted deacylase